MEHFNQVMSVLFSVGFVYSTMRLRNIQKIHDTWPWHSCIKIGFNKECKMVLHGCHTRYLDFDGINCVTLEKFLEIFKSEIDN